MSFLTNYFPKAMLSGVALGVGYQGYKAFKEHQSNKQKEKLYRELKLGAYSKETVKALHAIPDEELTAKELFDQLNTYATFGIGTQLNAQLNSHLYKYENSSSSNPIFEQYRRAIHTVDCLDAGLPYSDLEEVRRCNKLKDLLGEKLALMQPKQNAKK